MDLSAINIQWIGHRKDSSNKGAIVGWFVPAGFPKNPLYPWEERDYDGKSVAFLFRGKIGKKLFIEERELTYEFLEEVKALKKNYKEVQIEKITKNWGNAINEELSMFILVMKLKHSCDRFNGYRFG